MPALVFFEIVLFSMLFAIPLRTVQHRWSELTPKSWKEYPNIKRVSEQIEKDKTVQEIMKKSQE